MYAYYAEKFGRLWWVAQLPGQDGVDWGWTTNTKSEFDPPIKLSVYWQRRFRKDCERAGRTDCFTEHKP